MNNILNIYLTLIFLLLSFNKANLKILALLLTLPRKKLLRDIINSLPTIKSKYFRKWTITYDRNEIFMWEGESTLDVRLIGNLWHKLPTKLIYQVNKRRHVLTRFQYMCKIIYDIINLLQSIQALEIVTWKSSHTQCIC